MLAKLMGAAVFSVGFFMLLIGLADLLGIGGLQYDLSRRILIYLGGVLLCIIGYMMARRFPRSTPLPPTQVIQTTTEVHEPTLPPDQF